MKTERWGTVLSRMEKADEEDERLGLDKDGGKTVAQGSYYPTGKLVKVQQSGYKVKYA